MPVAFQRDARVYVGGYELTGQIRAPALDYGAEPLDSTVLGSTTRSRVGGLKTVAFANEGFFHAAGAASSGIDAVLFGRVGVSSVPVTMTPTSGTDGALSYLFQALHGEYSLGGSVGELVSFSVRGEADDNLVRGTVMRNSTLLGSSNPNGTATDLGSSTDKTVYAALHVLEVTGGSTEALVLILESAASSGMGGATTRITFTGTTASTAEWQRFDAGTTQQWWRQRVTTPTSSAKFHVVVSAGVSTQR